jgi:hypothetical protein
MLLLSLQFFPATMSLSIASSEIKDEVIAHSCKPTNVHRDTQKYLSLLE